MKKALHIFAVNGKTNSGDFFLGPSTKHEFETIISDKVEWTNFDVRKNITKKDIDYINTFDYVIIGGGGLFLPDTNPNMVSCWQWSCPSDLMELISSKIYVISVGWNHFYGQDITMPYRDNNTRISERNQIFKRNVQTLINKSQMFTMRHNGDCEELKNIVDQALHDKIQFSFCPVVGYVKEKYKSEFKSGDYITFEIKDDRPNRRYMGTSRKEFYDTLYSYITYLKNNGEEIAIMSHDGSSSFVNYLKFKRFSEFKILNNTVANEKKIINNYSNVKRLYCTAGHSQMMAHALGLDNYSLVGHNKLYYFLQDTDRSIPEHGAFVKDITLDCLLQHYEKNL